MTRVIAGIAGGRRLAVPTGRDTRPTSDRTREGLFSSVHSILGPLDGARVLDLYAGSGAVGLEALSRGAAHVLLVESGARATAVIRENIRALGMPGAELRQGRADRELRRRPEVPYDLVFADPPYATDGDEVSALLRALQTGHWLAPDGLVVLERPSREPDLAWPDGYVADRVRRYGEAALHYARVAG